MKHGRSAARGVSITMGCQTAAFLTRCFTTHPIPTLFPRASSRKTSGAQV